MQSSFPAALAFVLKSEGGNDDDKQDHGGRTSRGVTQREYNAWRSEQHLAHRDVWKADDAEISKIFHDEYWVPNGDIFPVGIDYLFFDSAVLAGPYRAAVLLQRALKISADGRVGPVTRQAVVAADPRKLINDYSTQKIAFYRSLHQRRFLKGWLNRVSDVKKNALSMLQT